MKRKQLYVPVRWERIASHSHALETPDGQVLDMCYLLDNGQWSSGFDYHKTLSAARRAVEKALGVKER